MRADSEERSCTLVRAYGNGPLHVRQDLIPTLGQRLLDQNNACLSTRCDVGCNIGVIPALVSIDDKRRLGRSGANRGNARAIALGAKLDLEQRAAGGSFAARAIASGAAREIV